jgi:hypothetical protein
MAGDVDMLSDSDVTPSSDIARHVVTNGNGNGHINGDLDSSMSEDDDVPLVRDNSHLHILPIRSNSAVLTEVHSPRQRRPNLGLPLQIFAP